MPGPRYAILFAACLALLLQSCASAPDVEEQPVVENGEPVPELTLNLPSQPARPCACEKEQPVDYNMLEKGFRALAAGNHKEAVNYFRRYQRLETSAAVDWEAEIAVAYDKMFPKSPYYNSKTAAESYHRLKRSQPEDVKVHQTILLMRDALELLVTLHQKIDDLQNENDALLENLEKREEALKRLRELTLDQ